MTRSRTFFLSHWQQGIIVVVVFVAIQLTSGSQKCSGEPCMYGICMNSANSSSYSCYCIDGYTGINCEINWDDCWSDPCLNGGTCSDAVASYNCTCPDGFIGLNCELKYSECINQPCLNNGTCIDANGFLCQCPEGYSGDYCEIDASVCNNTICKNAGECVEGPGYSFYCRCTEGWSGLFCEEDVDECIVSPCQNGGLCLNVPATYTCACLFGFTGKDCDKAIVPCEDNPCENNAMCLLEDSQPVCYCVPDYHGQLCELRYNDCESKFARCENGGTCIDGINNFTCACLPEYGGEICLEYNPSSTTILTTSIAPERSKSTPKTLPLPTTIYFSTQETATSPSTSASIFPQFTSTPESPIEDLSSTIESTDYPSLKITNIPETSRHQTGNVSKTFSTVTTPMDQNAGSSTSRILLTDFTTSTATDLSGSTESGVENHSTDPGTSAAYSVELSESSETTIIPTELQDTTRVSINSGVTLLTTETLTVFQKEEISTVELLPASPSLEEIFTTISTRTGAVGNESSRGTPESRIDEESWTIITRELATTEKISEVSNSFASSLIPSTLSTLDEESKGFFDTSTVETTVESNFTEDIFSTTRISLLTTLTTNPSPSSEREESSSTIASRERELKPFDCSEECANATCSQGASKCDCERKECKDGPSIKNAAFNGRSYVRQQVNIDENGSLRIYIRLKTKSKSGVLVHAFFDDERYVLLYMEGGQLKFQFSCGLQTMLLGEIDSPINNGYDVDVEMRFQYLIGTDDIGKCSARLLVNDTMAMSGEQILSSHEKIPQQVRVHLGGIPQVFSHFFPRIAMGFTGCISSLKVNNVEKHLIHDSTETYQIEECTSFLCLLNPCRNFGSCHDIDGQVYCKCIAGYSGAVCERSACDDSPCYLGATCISSPGSGFICVCPLGMHGLRCEEESAIVQPSFSVFIPGFSSYAAYGITNAIKDGMELRMRLVPHSIDQISLIAFMGQSGAGRDVSDHFSLTYVRGYIMLTWDLGSGVRRIFTKSPLRTRAHRPHTIRVGRRGRDAWLSVDDLGNVTGQAAGSMTQLDVSPILYIGGHKAQNFDTLPHDLPLHTGFSGCIFDIELRTEDTVFPITKTSPATGRGVGECHRNECSHNSCKNGALCLNHGPTYSCVCMSEWEGADCSVPGVKCSSSSPYKCQKANVSL